MIEKKRVVADFGGVIEGCYFHFCASLYKQIRFKGLEAVFRTNREFRQAYYRTKALCFVPVNFVVKAFNIVKEDACLDYQPIIDYLETYYIGELVSETKSDLRKVPLFPIPTWNVHDRTLERRARTQNNQEAWHGVFAQNIKRCPDLLSLVKYTQKEQKSTEIAMTQLYAGQVWRRNRKEEQRDEAIVNHILDFDELNIGEFLDIMAVVISQDRDTITETNLEHIDKVIDNIIID